MTKTDLCGDMRIDVLPNGPYKVSGGVPLVIVSIVRNEQQEAIAWKQEEVLPQKGIYMLCRCGVSHKKPYCDGSHVAAGFDGTEIANKESYDQAAERIHGSDITLYDRVDFCIGAEFCDRFGGIWGLTQVTTENCGIEDPEQAQQLVQQAHAAATEQALLCPSGRLVMHMTGEGGQDKIQEVDFDQPSIALIEDPVYQTSAAIWVRGGIPVYSADGERYEVRNRLTLCRCGASHNKPFCDGQHYKANFDDTLLPHGGADE
ncbi:MAG: CDGSH iron-sulfur domain-containing protein [Coriobacteriia bacterium]|nr:CDGSH iron-sulfur domain-containing protein [Coriobacteriia bacterium]